MVASVTANSETGIKFLTLEYIPGIFTPENVVSLVAAFLLSLSKELQTVNVVFAYVVSHK